MLRKHSSDSDDALISDLSRNLSMHRRHSSDSDEVPLTSLKSHSTLHKPDLISCDICDHVSTSIYASFEHNATHIIIPLVNLTLHQCEDCLHHFTSLDELTAHAKLKSHKTSQVAQAEQDIILQSIIKKQLVVKCHDLFNDIKEYSGISRNSTEVSKETNPENDAIVKPEIPTYVISDSDSDGRNSPLSDTEEETERKEQRQTKIEDSQTKAEHVTETIKENRDAKGEQSLLNKEELSDTLVGRTSTSTCEVAPPSKWHYSDSDNNSDIVVNDSEEASAPKWHYSSDSDNYKDINVGYKDKMKFYLSDEEIREVDRSDLKFKNEDGSRSPKRKINSDYQPIRNRLIFEEDINDITKEIPPNLSGGKPNRYLLGTPSTNFKPNSMIIGSQTNGNTVMKKYFGSRGVTNLNKLKILDIGVEENSVEYPDVTKLNILDIGVEENIEYPDSVPYETLVKTQICDCRYCGRCFCNRMQLILHEATHLRIRKPRPTLCPFCERFYAGNFRSLRKHLEDKHPQIDPDNKRPQAHVCKSCHLQYYNFSRHTQYYHRRKEEKPPQPVFKKHRYETEKVCDMCLNTRINEQAYKQLGTHSEIGRTQICCKCDNRHFSINLVRKRHCTSCQKEGNRSMSNEERLMRIKRKLKMIKQLNKCFWDGFILRMFSIF